MLVLHIVSCIVVFCAGGYCGYKYGSKAAAKVEAVVKA